MSRKAQIKAAESAARVHLSSAPQDPDALGNLIWCDPKSGWRGSAKMVQDAFTAEGLDPVVLLPGTPDYQVAFSRAILQVRTMIQGRGYTLLSAASGPNGESRYSVQRVTRDTRVTTTDEAVVRCPKDGSRPFVEYVPSNPNHVIREDVENICKMIMVAVDSLYETYTSDDVRQAFVRQIDMYEGLPCRHSPPHVAYYATPQATPYILKIARVYEALNWGIVGVFVGHKSDTASTKTIVHYVNTGLESQIQEFKDEAARYAADYEGMRPTTVEKRIEEAKAIKVRAELYRAILGAAVESIDAKVNDVETSLKSTLGLLAGEPPQVLTVQPPKSHRNGGTHLAPEDCRRRAAYERSQALAARDSGDDTKATSHEKMALAYDLAAEAMAS